ncbi:hypothetical protein CEXT_281681 [Caerostris extrusa]|uniref:Uncharacterized protein n=1 Tax=Caerostris extrusa TaxID=172846 RepID=A0AAV4XNF4_CAEEX|nr:hypothetical protein CEXT_281681 [Caerostris extrusa]
MQTKSNSSAIRNPTKFLGNKLPPIILLHARMETKRSNSGTGQRAEKLSTLIGNGGSVHLREYETLAFHHNAPYSPNAHNNNERAVELQERREQLFRNPSAHCQPQ